MFRWIAAGAVALSALTASAQHVEPIEHTLPNGMTFLLLPRDEQPNNVAAGWLARVGSVNEHPGITGVSHFLEHMNFKGTDRIGVSDPELDHQFRKKERELRRQIRELIVTGQYERYRAGEIDDPWLPKNDTDEIRELRTQLTALYDQQAEQTTVANEFDRVYTNEGGSGMNAGTGQDSTFYFINIPSNKLELWAWMESDRLGGSTLREFDAERDVVIEERRQTDESNPTGKLDIIFDSAFWQSSPYQWPIIGWWSDMSAWTEAQVREYFETYYQPSNLTGVIVGDFDPDEAISLIDLYFGRLENYRAPAPPMVTYETEHLAEIRMNGECDCQPQTRVRYLAVPAGHRDEPALDVMAAVLNGRTGRLYKSLVEDKKIASNARARLNSGKYDGYFEFRAQTQGDATPEMLEHAWYDELERLKDEPVPDHELQKVKNGFAADAYRSLQSNQSLMFQLAMYENVGGWEAINENPRRIAAVTADDILRVANEYFDKSNRCVGIYTRKAGSAGKLTLDGVLANMPEERREMMRGMLEQRTADIRAETDADKLRQGLAEIESQAANAPPRFAPVLKYMKQVMVERLGELEEGGEQ